ncbi:hypothetical protein [Nostoc sp. 2RC]|nr:hypothetical protein [Nostoc sp. 2RC]MBC1239126.1 hypothetical protein [Nostoc sp. 2RC]
MRPTTDIRRKAMSTTGYAYALIKQLSPEKLTVVVELLEFLSESQPFNTA